MSEKIQKYPSEEASITPEDQESPNRYTVPFSRLNDEIWRHVIALYFANVTRTELKPDDDIYYMLPVEEVAPRSAYRLGSRFSHNSKLMVDVYGRTPDNDLLVGFDFYVNESLSEKDAQQAEEVRDTFRANVNAYLLSTGQATPIE